MLARCKADGHLFALKILKKSSIIENDEKESILAERSVFSLVRSENNPFLVSCHGIYQSDVRLKGISSINGLDKNFLCDGVYWWRGLDVSHPTTQIYRGSGKVYYHIRPRS